MVFIPTSSTLLHPQKQDARLQRGPEAGGVSSLRGKRDNQDRGVLRISHTLVDAELTWDGRTRGVSPHSKRTLNLQGVLEAHLRWGRRRVSLPPGWLARRTYRRPSNAAPPLVPEWNRLASHLSPGILGPLPRWRSSCSRGEFQELSSGGRSPASWASTAQCGTRIMLPTRNPCSSPRFTICLMVSAEHPQRSARPSG